MKLIEDLMNGVDSELKVEGHEDEQSRVTIVGDEEFVVVIRVVETIK